MLVKRIATITASVEIVYTMMLVRENMQYVAVAAVVAAEPANGILLMVACSIVERKKRKEI